MAPKSPASSRNASQAVRRGNMAGFPAFQGAVTDAEHAGGLVGGQSRQAEPERVEVVTNRRVFHIHPP